MQSDLKSKAKQYDMHISHELILHPTLLSPQCTGWPKKTEATKFDCPHLHNA